MPQPFGSYGPNGIKSDWQRRVHVECGCPQNPAIAGFCF